KGLASYLSAWLLGLLGQRIKKEVNMRYAKLFAAVSCLLPLPAFAQQQQDPATLPRMQLERQFAGPLDATLIQRWPDPVRGTSCYLYLRVSVRRSAAAGSVQYGANTIGAISCTVAPGVAAPPARPSGGRTSRPSPSPAPATPLAPPDTPQR